MSVVQFAKRRVAELRRRFTREPHPPSKFVIARISNLEEFQRHQANIAANDPDRIERECELEQQTPYFRTPGFCFVCHRWTEFVTSWDYGYEIDGQRHVNWREHLLCPRCRLNNRLRATMHLLAITGAAKEQSQIYITEQSSALFRHVRKCFPFAVGSEHLGAAVPLGQANSAGLRNEDLTTLTFTSGAMDAVMSFDVFEHIPEYEKTFAECARILKPDGKMLFCVPFDTSSARNRIRARVDLDGKIEHLAPPEYHHDPLRAEGCLCFQHFGWEMLDQLKRAGFSKVSALCYYSRDYGYLGGEQIQFLAEKAT
ncbi:MAG: class I SAM-dependent methyltransferase [Verrucomicrobiota bacterium]